MVWGCFSWKGVGAFHEIKGILTRYRQILIRQMRPFARQLHGDTVTIFFSMTMIQNIQPIL